MPSVLIVEDEVVVADDLRERLDELGYQAFAIATSSDQAVRCAAARRPDIVLMDVRLRGVHDGIETATLLRDRFDVPIVYLTAHADDATLRRAQQTAPYGFLTKPVRSTDLRSVIEISLHKHELERQLRERDREQALLQKQLELSDRLSALGTMAAGVAHEINNPLAVVMTNTAVVQAELEAQARGAGDARGLAAAAEALAEVTSAAARIRQIVADLKAFSRPGTATAGEADLGEAIRWALRSTANEVRYRARVITDVAGGARVQLDETRLGQVVVNRVVNAAHAIAPGHVDDNSITLRSRRDAGDVVLEVIDTGCGMAPDVVARIFDPFYTTKEVGAGTGLGLAICHGIVTSAGGRLEVDSAPGRGSTFRLRLPAAVTTAKGSSRIPTTGDERRGRILVVDDEPLILKAMKRVLRDHDVVCVTGAAEALALIDGGARFDLLLSDMMMPSMTGMELYQRLAAEHPEVARRVVFVTGGAMNARIADFLAVVPNLWFEKPVPVDELRALVQRRLDARGQDPGS
ncbi:MAG TPA: response regulator [Kofleriaceae bacterium]|nr:response regulator [Kofleriaceae bacterium]